MRAKRNLISILISSLVLSSVYGVTPFSFNSDKLTPSPELISSPWMTGPLLAPPGRTIPEGHTNWEPYLFSNKILGHYDNDWNVTDAPGIIATTPTMVLTQGLTKHLDLQGIVPYTFNSYKNFSYSGFNDVQLILGMQALTATSDWWHPDFRLALGESFPAGKFDHIDPSNFGTDVTGAGSYQTTLDGILQNIIQLNNRFLRWRLSVAYTVPTSVHIAGFTSYGGGIGTNGTVDPGNVLSVDAGFEYTLTQNWVPALDITYTNADPMTFRGTPGVTPSGKVAPIGRKRSVFYTLAPAMEYNFSEKLGVIAGVWFSVAGRNAADFVAGVIAINYYH